MGGVASMRRSIDGPFVRQVRLVTLRVQRSDGRLLAQVGKQSHGVWHFDPHTFPGAQVPVDAEPKTIAKNVISRLSPYAHGIQETGSEVVASTKVSAVLGVE